MPAVDALGTHCSAVRAEMPSGMVPVRKLGPRYRHLKGQYTPVHKGGFPQITRAARN